MGSVLLRGRVGLRGVVHSATGVELLPTTVGLLSAARTAAVASVAGQLLGLEGELQSAPSATLPRTKRPPHGHQGLVLGTLVHSTAADYLRSQEPLLGETIVWKQEPPPWLKLYQAAEVDGVYKVDEVEQVDRDRVGKGMLPIWDAAATRAPKKCPELPVREAGGHQVTHLPNSDRLVLGSPHQSAHLTQSSLLADKTPACFEAQ